MMTVIQVAKHCGVHPRQVLKWILERKISSSYVASDWIIYVPRDEVERMKSEVTIWTNGEWPQVFYCGELSEMEE